MRTPIALGVAAVVAAAGAGWYAALAARRVGELSPLDSWAARRRGGAAFTPAAWRAAGPDGRGRMVADLARRHRFAGRDPRAVRALLGPNTCYWANDDVPCYAVDAGARGRALVFVPDYAVTPWRVRGVALIRPD